MFKCFRSFPQKSMGVELRFFRMASVFGSNSLTCHSEGEIRSGFIKKNDGHLEHLTLKNLIIEFRIFPWILINYLLK
jgi:hypothetical protein